LAPPEAFASFSPTLRIFSRPSRATVIILASEHVSKSQRGLIVFCWTRYLSCSGDPPEVVLEMAQAASFLISNSAFVSNWISGGIIPASTTAWIWPLFPAVILEMVQQASFLIPFLGLLKRARRHGRAARKLFNEMGVAQRKSRKHLGLNRHYVKRALHYEALARQARNRASHHLTRHHFFTNLYNRLNGSYRNELRDRSSDLSKRNLQRKYSREYRSRAVQARNTSRRYESDARLAFKKT